MRKPGQAGTLRGGPARRGARSGPGPEAQDDVTWLKRVQDAPVLTLTEEDLYDFQTVMERVRDVGTHAGAFPVVHLGLIVAILSPCLPTLWFRDRTTGDSGRNRSRSSAKGA
jgi:hypothetical protein